MKELDNAEQAMKYLRKVWRYVDSLDIPEHSKKFLKAHPFMLPKVWEKEIEDTK